MTVPGRILPAHVSPAGDSDCWREDPAWAKEVTIATDKVRMVKHCASFEIKASKLRRSLYHGVI